MAKCEHWRFIFVVVYILVLIETGLCLQCFECSDLGPHKNCTDPLDKSLVPKQTCYESEVCVKHVSSSHPDLVPETTKRGCMQRNYCQLVKHPAKHCSTCKTDLCNSATSAIPSFTVCALLVTKYFL